VSAPPGAGVDRDRAYRERGRGRRLQPTAAPSGPRRPRGSRAGRSPAAGWHRPTRAPPRRPQARSGDREGGDDLDVRGGFELRPQHDRGGCGAADGVGQRGCGQRRPERATPDPALDEQRRQHPERDTCISPGIPASSTGRPVCAPCGRCTPAEHGDHALAEEVLDLHSLTEAAQRCRRRPARAGRRRSRWRRSRRPRSTPRGAPGRRRGPWRARARPSPRARSPAPGMRSVRRRRAPVVHPAADAPATGGPERRGQAVGGPPSGCAPPSACARSPSTATRAGPSSGRAERGPPQSRRPTRRGAPHGRSGRLGGRGAPGRGRGASARGAPCRRRSRGGAAHGCGRWDRCRTGGPRCAASRERRRAAGPHRRP
jgi:hypothetical protein